MTLPDLPIEELRSYRPRLLEPPDLAEFWSDTLADARRHPVKATYQPVTTGLRMIDTFDVAFTGFGGHQVRGWLRLPAVRTGPLPCVVQYVGYGGGRGLRHEHLLWAAAGYAHFIMDTRGQGSTWAVGDTDDPAPSGPSHPGFMTRGILDPADYYYRRLYVDAVRAVDAVRLHDTVDARRVVVTGSSQGGGVALAVASLRDDLTAVMADVPFLSHFTRAVWVAEDGPYPEIARYLKVHRTRMDAVFRTLSYFDVATLVQRATAPALFSVGLQDAICPPSTVFAAYNAYAGPREMVEYAFNDHEGGEAFQQEVQLAWLDQRLNSRNAGSASR
jgi:cephalosporin-C deacetylase